MTCTECRNGWLDRGDIECVNGVMIDIDEAFEGTQTDVCYPPAPCMACERCAGSGCDACNDTGWIGGKDISQELLEQWRSIP